MNKNIITEDIVRDHAKIILGFDAEEDGIQQGTGQITTFNQLGFKGNNNKPDGWYLPDDKGDVAIILETKSGQENVQNDKWIKELKKNIKITSKQYSKIVGILYNGEDVLVVKYQKFSQEEIWEQVEGLAPTLQHKHYYLALFRENKINKYLIYNYTKQINDCLHFKFGIKNLYHRMIFTACALVAKRYGASLVEGMDYSVMSAAITSTLQK